MMSISRFVSIFLAMSLLGGCAFQHVQNVPLPNQANNIDDVNKVRVYVIRKPWLFNLASHIALVQVYDGGKKIGSIAGHRGYLSWEREPGDTTISAEPGMISGSDSIDVTLKKGNVYYTTEQTKPESLFPTSPLITTLELVDDVIGKDELAKAKPPAIKD